MITRIPVHPMTFKILVKENTVLDVDAIHGVLIQGESNSMLNDFIKLGNVDRSDATKSVAHKFTVMISIRHQGKIDRPHNLGFYFHKMYMRRAMRFVHAQVLGKVSAAQAIRNFCKLYEIYEDDIAEETLGRLWRRYYSSINHGKKASKSLPKLENIVLQKVDLSLLSDIEKTTYSDDISSQFIKINLDSYFNCRKHFNVSLMNQTRSYTMATVFKMTHQTIADLFGVSRQAITRRIETFKYFLLSDDMLAESYENTIKGIL